MLMKGLVLSAHGKIYPSINNHGKHQHSFHQFFLSNWVNEISDNVNG